MSPVIWIEASPRNPATALPVAVLLAGGGKDRAYRHPVDGRQFRAGVVRRPLFSARLGFDEKGWTGTTRPQTSTIGFSTADPALRASLAGLVWKDAPVTVSIGAEGAVPITALLGKVQDAEFTRAGLSLTIVDLSERLERPIITAQFAGSGGIEGPVEAKGRVKRRSWGYVFNVEGRLIDAANSVYEFGDPAFPLTSWATLRDKGREGSFTTLAWQGSIAATLAALAASSPARGGGVVAPSIACAKWWTQPAGPLTADFIGTAGTGGSMQAAAIGDAISQVAGGPAFAGLAAANALRPGLSGIHVAGLNESYAQAIDRLLLGVSLLWLPRPDGSVVVREWAFNPAAPVVKGIFKGRSRTFPPHGKRRVGFQRNERIHNDSEIAGILLEELTDGDTPLSPADLLNSAQEWADVQNGAGTRPADNATAGATLGTDFKSPGDVVYTQAEIETIMGTSGALFNQGTGATANSLSDLDATAAARLIDTMRSAAGALPAQFNPANYTRWITGGALSSQPSFEETGFTGYTVDAGGRSVVIGPGQQTISPLVDLPLFDGVIYEFRFELEVLSAAGGTSALPFFSFLNSDFVLQTNISAQWQQNLTPGPVSIRLRVGRNVPSGLVDMNVTAPNVAFMRPGLQLNLNATDTGNHPSAVTRFFGMAGSVDYFSRTPITRLTEDGTAAVTLDNFKTPLGTSAALANQGTGATANTLAELNAGEGAKLTGIEAGADVTATAQRSILPQFPVIEIKQGEAGHTGDRTVTHTALRGLFGISGGTWTLPSQNLGAGSASINASTGTVTLSGIVQSGAYAVRYTHTDGIGIELEVNVTFVPLVAAGVGSTASSAVRGFSTSTFAVVSEVMTISLPAGVTSAILQASDINLELALATPFGVTDAELKWQRETSPGVWGDVGAVATSSPSPEVADEGGLPAAIFGFITCNRVATGLTAGSTQKFRLSARVSGGNVRAVSSFGVVTAAA